MRSPVKAQFGGRGQGVKVGVDTALEFNAPQEKLSNTVDDGSEIRGENHLGMYKTPVKNGINKISISWCRISAINSIT